MKNIKKNNIQNVIANLTCNRPQTKGLPASAGITALLVLILSSLLLALNSCSDFLNETPTGIISEEQATDPDKLLISAYSALGNDHYVWPMSLWAWGSVRGGDAYKGGSGESDIAGFHLFEISTGIFPNMDEIDGLMAHLYFGISRCNSAIKALNAQPDTYKNKKVKLAEARFLRGHFYFLAKVMFKRIPMVFEDAEDETTRNNVDETQADWGNDAQWLRIAADFEYALENLPATQSERGRPDKFAAAAYAAKTYLYKAYRQSNPHSNAVTEINQADLDKVLEYTQQVMQSQYGLENDFGYNFLPGSYENGNESIFAVQYSDNDGTMFGRVNFSDLLATPQKFGCCDFVKPSQSLVNAYLTDNGLPANENTLDNYNPDRKYDPRMFHTVAMPGFPFKYNTSLVMDESWSRTPGVYGYYNTMKDNVDPDCDCFVPVLPFYANSKNRIIIRYADVMLIHAEAQIEKTDGNIEEARTLINQIRTRASNTGLINYAASHIEIKNYSATGWIQTTAREALRIERQLELALEHGRFFDLVRWGIAAEVMNAYYAAETPRHNYFSTAHFTADKNEYSPIPEKQVKFSKYMYKQNPGFE
jgi:hypothetical protein